MKKRSPTRSMAGSGEKPRKTLTLPRKAWEGEGLSCRSVRSPLHRLDVEAHDDAVELRARRRVAPEHQGVVAGNDVVGRAAEAPQHPTGLPHLTQMEDDGEGPGLLHVGVVGAGVRGPHPPTAAGPDARHLQARRGPPHPGPAETRRPPPT